MRRDGWRKRQIARRHRSRGVQCRVSPSSKGPNRVQEPPMERTASSNSAVRASPSAAQAIRSVNRRAARSPHRASGGMEVDQLGRGGPTTMVRLPGENRTQSPLLTGPWRPRGWWPRSRHRARLTHRPVGPRAAIRYLPPVEIHVPNIPPRTSCSRRSVGGRHSTVTHQPATRTPATTRERRRRRALRPSTAALHPRAALRLLTTRSCAAISLGKVCDLRGF